MEQTLLGAEERTAFKKGASRRLRREGKIPAIIYGRSANAPIFVDAHEFRTKFKTVSENTIINLSVGDKAYDVLVKDFQEDILTDTIVHIDFYEIEAGKVLRTNIPVRLEGTPAGVREGGILEHLLYNIEVECLPKDIPEKIEIDVSELGIGDSIHIEALTVPDGVRVLTASDQVVVAVTALKIVEEEVEEEEILEGEEGEEGEEGAVEGEEAGEATEE